MSFSSLLLFVGVYVAAVATPGPGIAALVAGDVQSEDGKLAPAVFHLAGDPDRPDEILATITLAYLGPQHQITVWPQTLTMAEYEAASARCSRLATTSRSLTQ